MPSPTGVATNSRQQSLTSPKPIEAAEFVARIHRARLRMMETGIDALVMCAGDNLRYFGGVPWSGTERLVCMGFTGSGALLVICPEFELGSLQQVLMIPAEIRTWQEHEDPYQLLGDWLRERGAQSVGLDGQASFLVAEGLRAALKSIPLTSAAPLVDGCRMIKSDAEIALVQHAMTITLEVQRWAAQRLTPGISTVDMRRFIDDSHRSLGAPDGSSFCAVQFGQATAYPHGVANEQTLNPGDLVLIDTGCRIEGYNSDITRTYVFGTPSVEQERLWQLEREAQQAAFDAVRTGVTCESIDRAARQVLENAGMGPDYRLPGLPHRTGHGIGLAIHEPPYLVRGDTTGLQVGMCFSNEPMLVIPDRMGIRLEDHFHVTANGARWFTQPAQSIHHPFG